MSKKVNSKKPDELQEVNAALGKSEAFIEKYLKQIIIGVVAIIVITLGVVLFRTKYVAPQEQKAQEQIYKGEMYFAVDSFQLAINGDKAGYIGFKKIAEEYGITKTANLANAYLGVSYVKLGDYKNAITYLSKFDGDDQMIAPALIGSIGDCYVELKDYDKAIDYFLKAADKANNEVVSPVYLTKAGVVYEEQKKYDKAVEVYTAVKDKYFNNPLAAEMDKRIERASLLNVKK